MRNGVSRSFRKTAGLDEPKEFLTTDWVLGNFGKQRKRAVESYKKFIKEGKNQPSPWEELKNQVYLGSDEFVEDAQCQLREEQSLKDIPLPQKLAPPKPLAYYFENFSKVEGMAKAYLSGHYTLAQVGEAFGVSYATVSRAVKSWEKGRLLTS